MDRDFQNYCRLKLFIFILFLYHPQVWILRHTTGTYPLWCGASTTPFQAGVSWTHFRHRCHHLWLGTPPPDLLEWRWSIWRPPGVPWQLQRRCLWHRWRSHQQGCITESQGCTEWYRRGGEWWRFPHQRWILHEGAPGGGAAAFCVLRHEWRSTHREDQWWYVGINFFQSFIW